VNIEAVVNYTHAVVLYKMPLFSTQTVIYCYNNEHAFSLGLPSIHKRCKFEVNIAFTVVLQNAIAIGLYTDTVDHNNYIHGQTS